MEDVEFTMKWRERLTASALERDDWRILMSVFSTTDRVQHMMYQFYDTEHPLYDEAAANREMTFFGETIRLRDAIPAIYKHMDRVMGDVLAKLEANDTLAGLLGPRLPDLPAPVQREQLADRERLHDHEVRRTCPSRTALGPVLRGLGRRPRSTAWAWVSST